MGNTADIMDQGEWQLYIQYKLRLLHKNIVLHLTKNKKHVINNES